MTSKKESIASRTTLCSIGEHDNDAFELSTNDLTVHSRTSILRKPSNWERSFSVEGQFNN